MTIERAMKCFANHEAKLTDYGNIKILDFKNPESSEFRIRFLFEEDYYRLHISGDLGELIACNYKNMTYEKFNDFVNNTGYFEGKICCHSRTIRYFDEDIAKSDLRKFITDYRYRTIEEFVNDELRESWNNIQSDEELLDEFFADVLQYFDETSGFDSKGIELLQEKLDGEWSDFADIGESRTDILDWYMLAFKLAQEKLNNEGSNNNA